MASRRRQLHVEMSLVPLADMLTNTVGIMIFVMIFAVIVAQGTSIGKRLPMERKAFIPGTTTEKQAVLFVCSHNTVLPWRLDKLAERFMAGLGKPTAYDYEEWKAKVNSRRIEDDLYVVTARCEFAREDTWDGFTVQLVYFMFEVNLRPGVRGDGPDSVRNETSILRRELANMDHNREYICFLLDSDSLEVLGGAREVARQAGFDTGWTPEPTTWPVRVVAFPPSEGGKKPPPPL